jgi:hypothetical protein
MLDPVYELWFGALQSLGAVATAIALIFVGIQTYFTRKQVNSAEHETTIRLRPWIYRMPTDEEKIIGFDVHDVRMFIKNTGMIAAHRIYLYYAFKKNRPDETTHKKNIENELLVQEPTVYERLLVPNETMYLTMPMDDPTWRDYEQEIPTFLHILVCYKFAGGDYEREGRYIAIVKLRMWRIEKLRPHIEREWAE